MEPRDALSHRLLLEEGLFFQRCLYHSKAYPLDSGALGNVIVPFAAVIDHDAIPYLNRKFGAGLAEQDYESVQIRHRTKSLASKTSYGEYLGDATMILQSFKQSFADHKGLLGTILNAVQPDVGITYYADRAIYSTYSVAYYHTGNNPDSLDKAHTLEIGYKTGVTSAYLYALASHYYRQEDFFVRRFIVRHNDYRYRDLIRPLARMGVGDDAVFFLLSERMMQFACIDALHQGGLFTPLVQLKFNTLALFHTYQSIKSLEAYARKSSNTGLYPQPFLVELAGLFNRDDKQFIKRLKGIRNAMIHYDWNEKLVPTAWLGMRPIEELEIAVKHSLDMDLEDFRSILSRIIEQLVIMIKQMISFPDYDVHKDPD